VRGCVQEVTALQAGARGAIRTVGTSPPGAAPTVMHIRLSEALFARRHGGQLDMETPGTNPARESPGYRMGMLRRPSRMRNTQDDGGKTIRLFRARRRRRNTRGSLLSSPTRVE
jgi:hypothetical protein